jgi:hypothetical protein
MAQGNRDRAVFASPAQRALRVWPAEQRLCRAVQAWEYSLAEILNVCGSLALRALPMKIMQF